MHTGGRENVYAKFAQDALKNNIENKIVCAQYRDDRVLYKCGEIQKS